MNLEEIRREVRVWANEPDYDERTLDGYVNEAVQTVCAEINIPGLKGFDVVLTVAGTAYAVLSGLTGGFSGRLGRVWFKPSGGSDYSPVEIKPSLESLMDEYPDMDEAGDVLAVALEGSTLWYQPIPAIAGSLRVVYYQDPPVLTLDADVPSVFPVHLHRQLCVDGACYIIWDSIEQGEDGQKPNTDRHLTKFEAGKTKLREWIASRRKHHISSTWGE